MPPPGRSDPIFPLTLTELAFVLIFLLLVLTGWMVGRSEEEKRAERQQKEDALAELARAEQAADRGTRDGAAAEALRKAEAELRRALAGTGGIDPERIVSALTDKAATETENRRLRQRIEDLDARVSALAEVRSIVEQAGRDGGEAQAAAARELLSALEFKRELEKAAGQPVAPGREREKARDYAAAGALVEDSAARPRTPLQLAQENRDLRARSAWLQNQLEARGGRDYPPCWAEEATGKPQYLLTIELRDGGLRVEPAWPPDRAADAAALPGLSALAGGEVISVATFRSRVAALDADSKAKSCRHYVRLVNRVGSLGAFNRLRYAVEDFFYKFEVR